MQLLCLAPATCLALTACSGDGGHVSRDAVAVLAVEAQPCTRPNARTGWAFAVGPGIVATAAHTVEGDLRRLEVDGQPAAVRTIDERSDLALLTVEGPGIAPANLGPGGALDDPSVVVVTGDGTVEATVVRTGVLVVDDATDRARWERSAHTLSPAVAAGTSGAPVLDRDGRVVGVVALVAGAADRTFAIDVSEVRRLLDAPATGEPARPCEDDPSTD